MHRTFRVTPDDDCFRLLLLIDGVESGYIKCVSEEALTEIGREWASEPNEEAKRSSVNGTAF